MEATSPTALAPTRLSQQAGGVTVTIVDPSGQVQQVVRCRDVTDALEVVMVEGQQRPQWTMLLMSDQRGEGARLIGRWAVGPKGLARVPYRPNPDGMENLIRRAADAYSYGQMTTAEVEVHLVEQHGAHPQDAHLAAAAARVLLKDYEGEVGSR